MVTAGPQYDGMGAVFTDALAGAVDSPGALRDAASAATATLTLASSDGLPRPAVFNALLLPAGVLLPPLTMFASAESSTVPTAPDSGAPLLLLPLERATMALIACTAEPADGCDEDETLLIGERRRATAFAASRAGPIESVAPEPCRLESAPARLVKSAS